MKLHSDTLILLHKSLKESLKICLICCVIVFGSIELEAASTKSYSENSITKNSELAKRYLKLGNSYREAGNFDLAFHYISLGQQTFHKQRNFDERYWYAVSLEFLGYCYRDMSDFARARNYFEQSLPIYRQIISMRQGSQIAIKEVIKKLEQEIIFLANSSNDSFADSRKIANSSPDTQIETTVLNLDNRRLTKFPDDITRKKIENISISNNRFTNFPDEILNYPTVKILNISFNRIRNFPDLSKLQSLEYLNLSDNRIIEVDASIGKLKNLEYLNLANNRQLKNISLEIGKLRNTLKILDIRNTRIDESLIRQLTRELPNTNIISGNDKKRTNTYNFDSTAGEEW